MLTYDFSKRGDKPKYLFLYESIRDDIAAGKIERNTKLPSKRTLANHLNVGINTVANAYDLLVGEGYVKSSERKGFFADGAKESPAPEREVCDICKTKQKRKKADEPFLNLMSNRTSVELFPATVWNQLMRKTLNQGDELFRTVPFNGLLELRCAISGYLARNKGMEVDAEQIVIGAGSEYLYMRLAQLFGKTRIFGFEDPGYKKLPQVARSFENLVEFVPIDEHGLRVDALAKSDVDVMHVSPANHFPTGIIMPASRRDALVKWAQGAPKHYIIEDDYDSEFRYNEEYIAPLFSEDAHDKVIYMNTFSKTLVPSIRISYMVLPPKLLEKYKERMGFYSNTVSSFEQFTLAQFISEGHFERHINRLKKHYKQLKSEVIAEIKGSKLGEISEIIDNNAGTHFLLNVKTCLTHKEVAERAKTLDLTLNFLTDYLALPKEKFDRPDFNESENGIVSLVFNCATVRRADILEAIDRLTKIFL
ncbi:MAG: PLP-dependent aminotransferase family protein [Phoenicibacter congonensis]|uniref:PLP-dependent aminotransferase family protein n=1 Tax=Phoenicibacter congonensis TaxID=1944646 RepID=A0AA43RJG6_9ACTN|nr:PLP-dependent aminotransferase family protein [Phoenicibacter congonensis]